MAKNEQIALWRNPFDQAENERVGLAAGIKCEDESLTVQAPAADCDINVIARRFGIGAMIAAVPPADARYYGDFTDVPDLRTALDTVKDANDKFMALPAELRARFDNDPAKLWAFVTNADNCNEAVELGLLRRIDLPDAIGKVDAKASPE